MPPALKAISSSSASVQVLHQLSALIVGGTFKVGAFLPAERELAAQLGVSRGVVREAATKLEEQGLVVIRQGIGVEVVNHFARPVEQTIERLLRQEKERFRQCAQARLVIEPELAALAAVRRTPAALKKLGTLHEAMAVEQDVSAAAGCDAAFHDAIAELAGNKVLSLMLQSIATLGRLNREVTIRKFGMAKAYRHHGEILAALAKGDPTAARGAMKRHLEAARIDLD